MRHHAQHISIFIACLLTLQLTHCTSSPQEKTREVASDAALSQEAPRKEGQPEAFQPREGPSEPVVRPDIEAPLPESDPSERGTVSEQANRVEVKPEVAHDKSQPEREPPPPPSPSDLRVYLTGDVSDAKVSPQGPGLILMGGGPEVDAAFRWWKPRIKGGDVVVLRTSGSDGYNDYLYRDIGGAHSVLTILVKTRAQANSDYVRWHLSRAEGIFLAGGDQSTYVRTWQGTAVENALHQAWTRGALLGGTSAGLAVLGQFVYDAKQGSVVSREALNDPYHPKISFTRGFLNFPIMRRVITDSHFGRRDRMGRLISFMARLRQDQWTQSPTGLGIDERTALVIDSQGQATVMGRGAVYILRSTQAPTRCRAKQTLEWNTVARYKFTDKQSFSLSQYTSTSVPASPPPLQLRIKQGVLAPSDPYGS